MQLTTTEDQSLNGYMVASRLDTGTTLDGNVPYVGTWEAGSGMKLLCNGVSTSVLSYATVQYVHILMYICDFGLVGTIRNL